MRIVTVAVLSMCAGLVFGQSPSCQTPDGKSGECISISNCRPLLTLVNKSSKTDLDLTLLTRSHCGSLKDVSFVPKVCCPKKIQSEPVYSETCSTPDGKPGKCLSIYSCPHISNMLRPPVSQETIDFVQKSKCNNTEKYSVCCGPRPVDERSHSPCQVMMTAFPPDPDSECCGQGASVGNKIVGGTATAIDEHPWTAIIEYINSEDQSTSVLCGGALISGKYVLTAAHCIAGKILDSETPNVVRLGEYDILHKGKDCTAAPGGGEDCTDGDTRIAIERTIPHPMYDPTKSKRNDVGLIRLKGIAPFTDFIRPVCLPVKDLTLSENTPPDFSLFAVGWGATETRRQSDVKVHVDVPFVSQEKCQPSYNRTGRTALLWKGQLCAGGLKNKDTCQGDSGGPLVYEDLNSFQLVGIVSYGPVPCGLGGVPGIYSNVYAYLDWINSVIVP